MHLGVALVGLGRIGRIHLQAMRRVRGFRLHSVCDVDPRVKSLVPSTVPFYSSVSNLLALSDRPAVAVVATPNPLHYSLARQLIEENIHVLVEKPATYQIAELESLYDIADKHNVTVGVAFHAFFGNEVEWFVQHYNNELEASLGVVSGFNCFVSDSDPTTPLQQRRVHSGNSWLDDGVNALSVLGRLFDPERLVISNTIGLSSSASSHEDFSYSVVRTCDGQNPQPVTGTIFTSWSNGVNHKWTDLYFGETSSILRLDHSYEKVEVLDCHGVHQTLADCSGPHSRMVNHYIGVYRDWLSRLTRTTDNRNLSLCLHKKLLSQLPQAATQSGFSS